MTVIFAGKVHQCMMDCMQIQIKATAARILLNLGPYLYHLVHIQLLAVPSNALLIVPHMSRGNTRVRCSAGASQGLTRAPFLAPAPANMGT